MDRVAIEIEECRNMGINVLPPNINQSFGSFTVITSGTEKNKVIDKNEVPTTIRFGLKAIKNIGDHIAEEIIRERKAHGPYKDISDFLERVQDKDLNKKSLESLIKCGGLDKFGDRGELLGNMDNLLNYNREITQSKNSGQTSLFASAPILSLNNKIKLEKARPATQQEMLAWEKELLGLYITEHPLSNYRQFLNEKVIQVAELAQHMKDYQVDVVGVVVKIQKIITRSSEAMLFVKIEDLTGSLEILVFPSLLKETLSIWQEGKVVICRGKLSDKDQDIKLLCNRAKELNLENAGEIIKSFTNSANNGFSGNGYNNGYSGNGFRRFTPDEPGVKKVELIKSAVWQNNSLYITISDKISAETMAKLKQLLENNAGVAKVYFKIKSNQGQINTIETDLCVNNNSSLIEAIEKTIGHKA
jgi:DNA polymerase-3 subunit alpha